MLDFLRDKSHEDRARQWRELSDTLGLELLSDTLGVKVEAAQKWESGESRVPKGMADIMDAMRGIIIALGDLPIDGIRDWFRHEIRVEEYMGDGETFLVDALSECVLDAHFYTPAVS